MNREELKKILSGQGLPYDKEALNKWIHSSNFETELHDIISSDLQQSLSSERVLSDPELKAMADDIISGVEKLSRTNRLRQPQRKTTSSNILKEERLFPLYIKVAAALLLVVSVIFIAVHFLNAPQLPVTEVAQTIYKENPKGRKSTIFLRDGSVVYLNSESKIQYPENFSDAERTLMLEGEAFFEIAKDENRPFIVKTGNLDIRVLGTTFNVHAYAEDDNIKVSLSSGKVIINNENAPGSESSTIELNPGQSVFYSTIENSFSKVTNFNRNLDLSWKDGKIVFENADMEFMLKQFERWYNVHFELSNKPYFKWNYTGEFANQTLEDVLESLSFSQSFNYSITDKEVKLVFKPLK